ncbi:cytochrome b5-like heme/steroid binding domain-containing protein [Mycena metata]|uniref:Cytochrome b5-like heme/steroid binding domain-containing protein n=1 Tax=Mycena metata TaxID=1033252 RepID=A0AAD7K083_9AGAR|nr:cytochrome b5-like heme/steroid binding domain-containing protein [Mycena metata]
MSEKIVTLAELKEHNTKDKLWLVLHGKVYDATKFADEHPGGEDAILSVAGQDGSDPFDDVGHSKEARELLVDLLVGKIEGSA